MIDTHIHADARTGEDFKKMYLSGIDTAITCAYYPYRKYDGAILLNHLERILNYDTKRAQEHGLELKVALGVHPTNTKNINSITIYEQLEKWIENNQIIAIGEIGLENLTTSEYLIFTAQLDIAQKTKTNVIIHTPRKNKSKILNEILPESKSDAKNTLMNDYKVSAVDSDEIVKMTHPDNPRPVTFVASSDMLVKAGWWTYFGNWKFDGDETEAYSYYVSTEQAEINKTGQSGVVPLHSEYGLNFTVNITRGSANNTDAQVNCNFESNGSKVFVNDTEYNPLKAGHILVVEDGYLVRNDTLKNATDCNFTLYVIGYNGTYTAILMSDELVDSMFTRLYLLGGYGQDVFTQVHMGNGISLWQVNFENTVAGGRAASTGTEVSNSTSNSTDSSNGTSS